MLMVNKLKRKRGVNPNGESFRESKSRENIRIKIHDAMFFLVKNKTADDKKINGNEITVDSKNSKTKNTGIEIKTAFIDYLMRIKTVVSFLKSKRLSTTAD